MFRTIVFLATAVLIPSFTPCVAQEAPVPQVQPRAILRLHFADSLWVAGRVMGQVGQTIPLRQPGSSRPTIEYRISSLDSIETKSGDHAWAGAGIGLAVGYVLGKIVVARGCSDRGQRSATCRANPDSKAYGNSVAALMGAIGFVAGNGRPKWTRIEP